MYQRTCNGVSCGIGIGVMLTVIVVLLSAPATTVRDGAMDNDTNEVRVTDGTNVTQWEYLVERLPTPIGEARSDLWREHLNALGIQGWELISIDQIPPPYSFSVQHDHPGGYTVTTSQRVSRYAYLKRPKKASDDEVN